MAIRFKKTSDLKKKPVENEFVDHDNPHKKVLPFREDHPFLEVSGLTLNNEVIFEIGLRPTLRVDDKLVVETMEQVRVIGVLPDYTMALGKKIHPTIQRLCQDHMMGTTMNQFLKRLNWRNTANIENIVLFPRTESGVLSQYIDFNRLTLFFEMLLNGFVMLDCSVQTIEHKDDEELVLRIQSRGTWMTYENELLPKMNGLGMAFSKKRLAGEFERFYSEMKSGTLANEAVKAQIMTTIASELYKLKFEEEVDSKKLLGPHKRLNVLSEAVTLSDILQRRVAQMGLAGPDGEPLKK